MQRKPVISDIVIIGAIWCCLALPAWAQTSIETPESVTRAYMAATQAGDWAKCASLMHPEALAQLKRMFAPLVAADKSGRMAKDVFGLKSNAEYAQLSDAQVFERFMRGLTELVPQMKAVLSSMTSTILGQVQESPDLAHVVYRSHAKVVGASVSKVEVMTLKRDGDAWRALLTGDMEEIFSKLAGAVATGAGDESKQEPAGKPARKP